MLKDEINMDSLVSQVLHLRYEEKLKWYEKQLHKIDEAIRWRHDQLQSNRKHFPMYAAHKDIDHFMNRQYESTLESFERLPSKIRKLKKKRMRVLVWRNNYKKRWRHLCNKSTEST